MNRTEEKRRKEKKREDSIRSKFFCIFFAFFFVIRISKQKKYPSEIVLFPKTHTNDLENRRYGIIRFRHYNSILSDLNTRV